MFSNNQLDKNHPIYKELVKILKWNGYVFTPLIFITILYLLYINHLSTTKTTNLDYILPNEQKCNKEGMNNGLYCFGGFKRERDMAILSTCYQVMYNTYNTPNKKYWEHFHNIWKGGELDWNTFQRGGLLPIQGKHKPCSYILKALEMIDDGRPYMPKGKMIYCGKQDNEQSPRICNNPDMGSADGQQFVHHPNRYDDYH